MLPYSLGLLAAGLVLVMGWVALDLPLGPGAQVYIETQAFTAQAAPITPAT